MSKRHFFAVWENYLPNSAMSNRMLAYLEAWSNMDVEITVVFILPDRNFSRLSLHYDNIKFIYLWEGVKINNYLLHNALQGWYVRRFIKKLKSCSNVFIYGGLFFLHELTRCRHDIHIFHERTEHPFAVKSGNWPFSVSLEKYIKDCKCLSGLFVISEHLKSFFVDMGVKPERLYVVNMIVDDKRFEGIRKKDSLKKYIAYCGNASNNKDGVDQLIESFALISPKYPDLYLYIIGKAPDCKEENNNLQLSQELGVSDKVVFTGTVTYDDMPQILTDAVILALDRPDSLQAKHGFPTKLGEYLLTGNPVVVTSVGDIPRFLKDGENAMLAEPNQPEIFASKIEWLLNNLQQATSIGNRGRLTAKENFNNSIEARKIIDAIFPEH
jgi:glycosyltransferase involved in cell wall biosynthesis